MLLYVSSSCVHPLCAIKTYQALHPSASAVAKKKRARTSRRMCGAVPQRAHAAVRGRSHGPTSSLTQRSHTLAASSRPRCVAHCIHCREKPLERTTTACLGRAPAPPRPSTPNAPSLPSITCTMPAPTITSDTKVPEDIARSSTCTKATIPRCLARCSRSRSLDSTLLLQQVAPSSRTRLLSACRARG